MRLSSNRVIYETALRRLWQALVRWRYPTSALREFVDYSKRMGYLLPRRLAKRPGEEMVGNPHPDEVPGEGIQGSKKQRLNDGSQSSSIRGEATGDNSRDTSKKQDVHVIRMPYNFSNPLNSNTPIQMLKATQGLPQCSLFRVFTRCRTLNQVWQDLLRSTVNPVEHSDIRTPKGMGKRPREPGDPGEEAPKSYARMTNPEWSHMRLDPSGSDSQPRIQEDNPKWSHMRLNPKWSHMRLDPSGSDSHPRIQEDNQAYSHPRIQEDNQCQQQWTGQGKGLGTRRPQEDRPQVDLEGRRHEIEEEDIDALMALANWAPSGGSS